MVLTSLLGLLGFPSAGPAHWFGPVVASFRVEFDGNPYDPAENDVHVQFLGAKGEPEDRIAYYDGKGSWKAVLVTQTAGKYHPVLVRNGRKSTEPAEEPVLEVDKALPTGYLRPDATRKNRFRRDSGEPFFPVGFNLGWQDPAILSLADQIAKMGKNGVNWTRIWSSSWDGKNPWWPQGEDDTVPGELWTGALDKWQSLVDACDASGVNFQFVLHNHGSFSSTVNPNWPDHPWNAKKGGFLKDAADFFTDPEAKRRTKMWLRYAVARYGASPRLMAWELFNEVEWVDARYANRWGDIEAWHKEMAEYLRTIDPYHHMITTSSAMDRPALWSSLDYVQPHTYPSSILASIYGAKLPPDKPGFFGEFGPGGKATDNRQVVRDGLYAGILANQAGTGMYWYWDAVEKEDLYPEFAQASKVLTDSEFASHGSARKLDLRVVSPGAADLVLAPGAGWETTKSAKVSLPAAPDAMAGISSFLQGRAHREMFPEPLTLSFKTPKAGTLYLATTGVSKQGAALRIAVNGKEAVNKTYPADAKGDAVQASFPAGYVTVEISNDGPDWVQLGSLRLTGIGPEVSALGLGETDWALIRLSRAPGVDGTVAVDLSGLSLPDGSYEAIVYDLVGHSSRSTTVPIQSFGLKGWKVDASDQMLLIKRR